MTTATNVAAALNNDGSKFESDDGRSLTELAAEQNGVAEFGERAYRDDAERTLYYVDGVRSSHISGDPIRYVFPDSSAIVEAGDGWDIEGAEPFSWV